MSTPSSLVISSCLFVLNIIPIDSQIILSPALNPDQDLCVLYLALPGCLRSTSNLSRLSSCWYLKTPTPCTICTHVQVFLVKSVLPASMLSPHTVARVNGFHIDFISHSSIWYLAACPFTQSEGQIPYSTYKDREDASSPHSVPTSHPSPRPILTPVQPPCCSHICWGCLWAFSQTVRSA